MTIASILFCCAPALTEGPRSADKLNYACYIQGLTSGGRLQRKGALKPTVLGEARYP